MAGIKERMRYLKGGEDFTFDPAWGFTGSAQGRHDARNHPVMQSDEYGDGTYVERERASRDRDAMKQGGRARRAKGGEAEHAPRTPYQVGGTVGAAVPPGQAPAASASPLSRATITMPVADASRAAAGLAETGRAIGARQTIGNLAGNALARRFGASSIAGNPNTPGAMFSPVSAAPPRQARAAPMPMAKGGHYAEGGREDCDEERARGGHYAAGGQSMSPLGPQPAPEDRFEPVAREARQRLSQLPSDDDPDVRRAIEGRAKGGFIKKAIKHPGRMQRGAKRAGMSTHAYMEAHQHDPGSLGSAARLGLRMTGGDLSPRKRKG